MAARGAAARCPVLPPKCSDPLRGTIFQAARKRAGARRLPAAGGSPAAPRADSSAGRLPFCVFLLCALNAFVCACMHICCVVCKFSHVQCVSLACSRAHAHAETPCGVQVFACALCVLMRVVFVWVRARMRKLPAVCKFLCVHCVFCCVWCLSGCARACGNSLRCASFVCALCVVLCVVNVCASARMRKCCAVCVFCYYGAY